MLIKIIVIGANFEYHLCTYRISATREFPTFKIETKRKSNAVAFLKIEQNFVCHTFELTCHSICIHFPYISFCFFSYICHAFALIATLISVTMILLLPISYTLFKANNSNNFHLLLIWKQCDYVLISVRMLFSLKKEPKENKTTAFFLFTCVFLLFN